MKAEGRNPKAESYGTGQVHEYEEEEEEEAEAEAEVGWRWGYFTRKPVRTIGNIGDC